jgi:hypothetical protein
VFLPGGFLRPVPPRRVGHVVSIADLCQAISCHAILRRQPAHRCLPHLAVKFLTGYLDGSLSFRSFSHLISKT